MKNTSLITSIGPSNNNVGIDFFHLLIRVSPTFVVPIAKTHLRTMIFHQIHHRMKRILTLLLLASTMANQAQAQAALSRFGFALGGDIDMPLGLDGQYLLSTADRATFSMDDVPFSVGELTMMDCDNGTARLNFAIANPAAPYTEWQFSLLGITGRIDMVRYEKGEEGSPNFQWMEVNATNKETAVEGVYIRHKKTGETLRPPLGRGHQYRPLAQRDSTGEGPSGGQRRHRCPRLRTGFCILVPTAGKLQPKALPARGMSIRFFKKMEFGLELRKGFGYRASFGGPFHATLLSAPSGISLRCKLF